MVRYADDIVIEVRQTIRCPALPYSHAAQTEGSSDSRFTREKTRLMEFGRFAAENRGHQGKKGKPETFNFLGFTHISGKDRNGRFMLIRKTHRDRMTAAP